MRTVFTASEDETQRFGEELARSLKNGDVVALDGQLGAGKTVLTRGIARGLGITAPITSPTFTIMHRFDAPVPLNHFDAYRLGDADELFETGYWDCLSDGVTVVEWACLVPEAIPANAIRVTVEREGSGRRITITGPEDK